MPFYSSYNSRCYEPPRGEFPPLMLDFEVSYRSMLTNCIHTVPVSFGDEQPLEGLIGPLIEESMSDRPIALHYATCGLPLAERHIISDIRKWKTWSQLEDSIQAFHECKLVFKGEVPTAFLEAPTAVYHWRRYYLECRLYNACRKATSLKPIKFPCFSDLHKEAIL